MVATNLRRDKQQGLTFRPELVEVSYSKAFQKQVLMPINHGQQGRCQPVSKSLSTAKPYKVSLTQSHQKLTETANGFIGLRNFFITSLWSLMPCSPARCSNAFALFSSPSSTVSASLGLGSMREKTTKRDYHSLHSNLCCKRVAP
jgi:hypothetical protein